jgi:hypothetical protein
VKDSDEQGDFWETRLIPDDQEIEAKLVARLYWSRCTESSAIARRSSVWRQQDPIEDVPVILKEKKRCNYVREPCVSKREGRVQSRGRDEVGAYCRSAASSSGYGGAAVSGCGSLAAL